MPRFAPFVLAAIALAASVAPAWAFVDAPRALMDPTVSQPLAAKLGNVGGYRFNAIVTQTAPAGPTVLAEQVFTARQLGPTEGLIVVEAGQHRAGVKLGTALAAEKGLDGTAVQAVIDHAFTPKEAAGDTAGAIQALAEGLAGYTPAQAPAPSGSFPWGPLLGVLVAIGTFVAIRVLKRPEPTTVVPLSERVKELERQRATGELPPAAAEFLPKAVPPKPEPQQQTPPEG